MSAIMPATASLVLGAAAITLGFSFLGFFSSRFRLSMPLAMTGSFLGRRKPAETAD